jgi:hypothetical protein
VTNDYANIDFDLLPEVAPAVPVDTEEVRVSRFEGDTSALHQHACWALQNLLARRFITKADTPDLWRWVVKYRAELSSRLSELDLRLRIFDDIEVAFTEQAETFRDNPRARKMLRRESIGVYASMLAIHLGRAARTTGLDRLITREEIHEMFTAIPTVKDRDTAAVVKRSEDAINKMKTLGVLTASGDENSFSISPAIFAIITPLMIEEMKDEFERLRKAADRSSSDAGTSADTPETNSSVVYLDSGEFKEEDGIDLGYEEVDDEYTDVEETTEELF